MAQAVGSLVAVGMITRGYQAAETSVLTVFEYSFLIAASFWAWLIWDQRLDALGVLGIAMILTSGLIIARSAARYEALSAADAGE